MLAQPPSVVRRIVYLGTPEVAVPPLLALHRAGYEIPLVISRPDRRRGRGSTLSPSPVKVVALQLGLPVSDRIADAIDLGADLGVVVAYGRLIKPDILACLPMVNLHFSLLPAVEGAAPVERALLAGDEVTGVCVMQVAEGLDEGGVYRAAEVPIDATATLSSLRDRLVEVGTGLLLDVLRDGLGEPLPQEGQPVYADKIDPAELRLDLDLPAARLDRVVRLGGSWVEFRGRRLRIWEAEVVPAGPPVGRLVDGVLGTGAGGLALVTVQPEGRQRMAASAWMNGARPTADERLG